MSEQPAQQFEEMAREVEFYKLKCKLLEKQEKSLLKQVEFLEKIVATQDEVMTKLGGKLSVLEAETTKRQELDGQMTDLVRRIDRLGESLEEMWRRLNQRNDSDSEDSDDGFVEAAESSE